MMPTLNPWTEERTELARRLYCEGVSCSQIAKRLGGVSRNAVIGKMHRIGACGGGQARRAPSQPREVAPRAPRPRRIASPTPSPLMAEGRRLAADGGGCAVDSPPAAATAVSILQLTARTCRMPVGKATGFDQVFCGREPEAESPYCVACGQFAYNGAGRTREERLGARRKQALGSQGRRRPRAA